MMNLLIEIVNDTMKETQQDGSRKWSFLRISAFIWFWLGMIPSVYVYFFKNIPISPEIAMISGVFFLGVVGGKTVSTAGPIVQQFINKVGGGQ
jgi:hypothetical protein